MNKYIPSTHSTLLGVKLFIQLARDNVYIKTTWRLLKGFYSLNWRPDISEKHINIWFLSLQTAHEIDTFEMKRITTYLHHNISTSQFIQMNRFYGYYVSFDNAITQNPAEWSREFKK